MTVDRQAATFRELHESGGFVSPNPWDVGSARVLASLGFRALATSSAGLAFALGRPDSATALSLDVTLRNVRDIVEATDLPVDADFQSGCGATPDAVSESVAACVRTGVAGLSIEDASGDPDSAVAPKPVNVLLVDPSWMTLDTLADLGVRRISVGSALGRARSGLRSLGGGSRRRDRWCRDSWADNGADVERSRPLDRRARGS